MESAVMIRESLEAAAEALQREPVRELAPEVVVQRALVRAREAV